MNPRRTVPACLLSLVFLATGSLDGQRSTPQLPGSAPPVGNPSYPGTTNPWHPPEPDPGMVERQARSRNTDRQKRLVEDTDKLLSLATELKQNVDKTDKNMLSVDVIKKAEEIEKLAHSVKERMKG